MAIKLFTKMYKQRVFYTLSGYKKEQRYKYTVYTQVVIYQQMPQPQGVYRCTTLD